MTQWSLPEAKVLLDSVNPRGDRLTTLEVKMHRFVLAEFNTHRVFSRNSASSRAIPIDKQIARVLDDPAMPVEWGKNQAGMQANELIADPVEIKEAEMIWLDARDRSVESVRALQQVGDKGVHKQIANRLLEPWMWHTAIVSSTAWQNFANQRVSEFSPLAQPEMRACADKMWEAINAALASSTPQELVPGEWHTPLIQPDEASLTLEARKEISTARCARVSYLTHNGIRDQSEDVAMYGKLCSARPMHASPLEHVATPVDDGEFCPGNFTGFRQHRHEVESAAGIRSWL